MACKKPVSDKMFALRKSRGCYLGAVTRAKRTLAKFKKGCSVQKIERLNCSIECTKASFEQNQKDVRDCITEEGSDDGSLREQTQAEKKFKTDFLDAKELVAELRSLKGSPTIVPGPEEFSCSIDAIRAMCNDGPEIVVAETGTLMASPGIVNPATGALVSSPEIINPAPGTLISSPEPTTGTNQEMVGALRTILAASEQSRADLRKLVDEQSKVVDEQSATIASLKHTFARYCGDTSPSTPPSSERTAESQEKNSKKKKTTPRRASASRGSSFRKQGDVVHVITVTTPAPTSKSPISTEWHTSIDHRQNKRPKRLTYESDESADDESANGRGIGRGH